MWQPWHVKGKKLWILGSGIVIAALLGLTVWQLWPAPEPVYAGKPLSFWLGDGLFEGGNPYPDAFVPSTNHYSRLIRMIEAKSPPVLEKLKLWVNNRKWLKRRFQTVTRINQNGFYILETFHDRLEFAVPDLLQRYDHAARGSFERYAISVLLGRMASAGKAAAQCLSDTLADDPSARSRMEAAVFLGKQQLPAEVAVPALCKALGDTSSDVRRVAAGSLSRFGSKAVAALPALRKLAESDGEASPEENHAPAGPRPATSAPHYGGLIGQMTEAENARNAIRVITSSNRVELGVLSY